MSSLQQGPSPSALTHASPSGEAVTSFLNRNGSGASAQSPTVGNGLFSSAHAGALKALAAAAAGNNHRSQYVTHRPVPSPQTPNLRHPHPPPPPTPRHNDTTRPQSHGPRASRPPHISSPPKLWCSAYLSRVLSSAPQVALGDTRWPGLGPRVAPSPRLPPSHTP